jgi:AraC-like DNA-binding protein
MGVWKQQLVDWHSLTVGLMYCYSGEVDPLSNGTHEIPGAAAWLIEQGSATVEDASGHRQHATRGQWMMLKPGVRHQDFSEDVRLLSVNFRTSFHTGENLFDQGLSIVLNAADFPSLEKRARALLRVARRVMGEENLRMAISTPTDLDGYLLLQRALFDWVRTWSRSLIAAGLKPSPVYTSDPRVQQALQFLQAHTKGPNLDGTQIAAAVGLSLCQLNRQFLRERGETLRQCHQNHLSEHAKDLLMRSTLSVKEIATELGFRHQSHFTSWFLKQAHVTPREFRANPVLRRFFAEVNKTRV